ncbi:MAG: hypothetical protein GY777_26920 [Candidatus Brocadiaceae bacterium]|nr:hypothetical protein [Candidatus Brocadiaceae bacterium]
MEIRFKGCKRNILKLSLIGLVFILSCGKVEEPTVVEDGEPVQWYVKLGFKENMKQIKEDTQLLTRRLGEGDWADAEDSLAAIKASFDSLNLDSDEIPEEFFELKQMFFDNMAELGQISKSKDFDKADTQLKVFKHSCSYCHRILRKEFDRMNPATDYDVAVDKLYKHKNPGDN